MEYFTRLWNQSKALTAVSFVMLPIFALSVAGIFLDPRTITGVPAWLKPAKFAISIAIYAATLAWLFQFITVRRRFVRNRRKRTEEISAATPSHEALNWLLGD